ncbi:uncharacterized protein PHA67_000988 isoform 1-T1 [Liasis olivaceus]
MVKSPNVAGENLRAKLAAWCGGVGPSGRPALPLCPPLVTTACSTPDLVRSTQCANAACDSYRKEPGSYPHEEEPDFKNFSTDSPPPSWLQSTGQKKAEKEDPRVQLNIGSQVVLSKQAQLEEPWDTDKLSLEALFQKDCPRVKGQPPTPGTGGQRQGCSSSLLQPPNRDLTEC